MLNRYILFIIAVESVGIYLIICEFRKLKGFFVGFYQDKLNSLKKTYEGLKNDETRMGLENKKLEKEILNIAGLYELTKEMSSELMPLDIFEVLAKFLMKGFTFKCCKLVLMDKKDPKGIAKVYKIAGSSAHIGTSTTYISKPRAEDVEPDEQVANLVTHIQGHKEILKISSSSKPVAHEKECLFPNDVKSFLAIPLIIGGELIGILSIEDLDTATFENLLILNHQFILELRKAELYMEIQEMAITDGLTGAYVRRHFKERLDEELKRSKRHKFKFSFLMLDIDYFKRCNDTYGHLVGDAVLVKIVDLIKSNVRQIDLVARYGGEEFSILLPETDKEYALQVAERIRRAVASDRFKVYDEYTAITVSIGVATFPDNADSSDLIVEEADKALYQAKKEGRNRVICAPKN